MNNTQVMPDNIKLEDLEFVGKIFKFKHKPENITGQVKVMENYGEVYDENGNIIYFEDKTGWWCITKFDKNGLIYRQTSGGLLMECEYADDGSKYCTYIGDTGGSEEWKKNGGYSYSFYDKNGNEIGYESGIVGQKPTTIIEYKYNENNQKIYEYEQNANWWQKSEFNDLGKLLSVETSDGDIKVYEYNDKGERISESISGKPIWWVKFDGINEIAFYKGKYYVNDIEAKLKQ
jgi:hypothetical protein